MHEMTRMPAYQQNETTEKMHFISIFYFTFHSMQIPVLNQRSSPSYEIPYL